jgi:hypothetical protein
MALRHAYVSFVLDAVRPLPDRSGDRNGGLASPVMYFRAAELARPREGAVYEGASVGSQSEPIPQQSTPGTCLMSSVRGAADLGHDQTLEHFHEHGWMRVHQAFDADAAAAMRDVAWEGLAGIGVQRDAPATWTIERPVKLQHLKDDPAFAAVGSERLHDAIGAILETQSYERPKRWGALFIAFPGPDAWGVPAAGWHIDAHYASQLRPPKGVQTLALFGDILPRSGATLILSGAHRLIHRWFEENPPPADARSADMRRSLRGHAYFRDLHAEGDRDRRIARFMDRVEEVDGIPLQVVEATGVAGDVILLHPLTLHVAAPNNGAAPRFMLSGGVTTDMAGWAGRL